MYIALFKFQYLFTYNDGYETKNSRATELLWLCTVWNVWLRESTIVLNVPLSRKYTKGQMKISWFYIALCITHTDQTVQGFADGVLLKWTSIATINSLCLLCVVFWMSCTVVHCISIIAITLICSKLRKILKERKATSALSCSFMYFDRYCQYNPIIQYQFNDMK